MTISSNVLFLFFSNIKYIEQTMNEELWPRYCIEKKWNDNLWYIIS